MDLNFQVGSYARGMFLVHSECLETNYIASSPFRVNAVSLKLKDREG
jgi:3-dehydroquinate synthase class II